MDEQLIKDCTAKAQAWLGDGFDEETKAEVKAMLENEDKTPLIDAFYQNLEFGTGGLRGIMGAGTNRMNKYVVGMATQGFANYINKAFPNMTPAVVVGHDCRNNGRMYAETVAAIFSANGIKVYLFESLRPTPEISFAIRQLKAQAGVNVTASHNPKEYNGYKAYWDDGAQVLSPHDTGIIDEVNKVTIDDVKFEPNKELIEIIGGEMDWDYLQASNNFRFMTTKASNVGLDRGIYITPFDAFTNYMNILGDFINRVNTLYPQEIDNEELNGYITLIENMGKQIAIKDQEILHLKTNLEKLEKAKK